MDQRLCAVAHRPARIGCETQQSQQVRFGPVLAECFETLEVVTRGRDEIAALRVDLENQDVAHVLGETFDQILRIETLVEGLVQRVQRLLRVTPQHAFEDREERLAIGQPEHATHERFVDGRLAGRHDLIERADRVAHRAFRLVREKYGSTLFELELHTGLVFLLGLRDVEQAVGDLAQRDACEVEALRTRADRVGKLLRIGRREDEHEVRRRFFERLQQRCERVVRELVHLVDDHDAVLAARRREANLLAQRLNVGDTAIRCAVDFGDVERNPGSDLLAARARVARVGRRLALLRRARLAVERLGEDSCRRRLADAACTGKEVALRHAAALERAAEHQVHVVLADDVRENLRPVLESQRAMRHGVVVAPNLRVSKQKRAR